MRPTGSSNASKTQLWGMRDIQTQLHGSVHPNVEERVVHDMRHVIATTLS
jgi:hypothetical protein